MTNENQLLEQKELREKNLGRIEVLDQVKKLLLLGDTDFATMEMVAKYYDVPIETIKSTINYNREEIEANGYRIYTKEELLTLGFRIKIKRGGFNILDNQNNIIASGSNNGIALFSKRAILNVGMLLRDSDVAKEIQKIITGFDKSNLTHRKEIQFKSSLDIALKEIRNSLIKVRYLDEGDSFNDLEKKIILAINSLTTYIPQYNVCGGKYRIDFYFPLLNIAIEYDENYHNQPQKKDKQREYEITRDIYINKYYIEYTDKQIKDFEYKSKEEMFDCEYMDNNLECSFDLTEFIRVKEGEEVESLFKIISLVSTKSERILDSRGMSCKYDDLILSLN